MKEHAWISDKYTGLAQDVIRSKADLQWIDKAHIQIGYMVSDKDKKSHGRLVFADCRKVPDYYRAFIPYDFLITVYEQNCVGMSEEAMFILLYHELLHVGIDETGEETKYVVNPHDVEEFRAIIDQYGLDWERR